MASSPSTRGGCSSRDGPRPRPRAPPPPPRGRRGARRYYPLYAKCVELDIPVRAYTSMSYANDLPYDVAHPRHLDQVAVDLPELRLVAGLAGWPWVSDMVGLLRRHPNLY